MGKKKAQLSIFLIIGVALVIIVSLFFVFRNMMVEKTLEEDVGTKLIIEKVSNEFKPIQLFVDTCVKDVAVRGFRKLGMQGGYINSMELISNPVDPTAKNSDSIHFFPKDNEQKIAYWWYMKSSEKCFASMSCKFDSKKPELEGGPNSIEGQLEKYIDENIQSCLQNFAVFADAGLEIDSKKSPKSDITFTKDDTVVSLTYPLRATSKSSKSQDLSFFNTRIDINMRNMYSMAGEIAEQEARQAFLERQLIELISIYSGTKGDSILPPFYNPAVFDKSDLKFAWTQTEIKTVLSSLLSSYVSAFRVLNAGSFVPITGENEFTKTILDSMMIYINTTTDYTSFDVSFDYITWWDLYLKIGQSEIVKPTGNKVVEFIQDVPIVGQTIGQLLPDEFRFMYDVSYPVLVTIEDDYALSGDGYTFRFALESNLRNNMPVYEVEDSEILGEVSNPETLFENSFCNEDHKDTGLVKITVKDTSTSEEIEGILLRYSNSEETCAIGLTQRYNDGIYFEGKLPSCLGCVLEINAPGFVRKSLGLSVDAGVDFDVPHIELEPIREKEVNVMVITNTKSPGENGEWSIDFTPVPLRPAESVMLSLTRVPEDDDPFDSDFNSVVFFSGDDAVVPKIQIIPGKYEVQGQILLDVSYEDDQITAEDVRVPAEDHCDGGTFFTDCEEYTLPEIEFGDTFPEGSVYIDDEHGGTWDVKSNFLDSSDVITFYIIASPYIESGLDLNYDDLEEVGKADLYSDQYSGCVLPTYNRGAKRC